MGTKKIGDLITDNMGVYEGKTKLSFGKLVLLGMLAGAFIAIGASSSSAAVYGISNTGLAKMSFAVFDKRIRLLDMIRVLVVVFITNLIGACIVVVLVNRCGQLDYGNGALAAATIKTAYNKMNLSFMKAFTSGIMCNILVCLAVLLAGVCQDAIGKIFACFFPIWAFVIAGYEHCVANMYYIPAGLLAKHGEAYYNAAIMAGMTPDQLNSMTVGKFFLNNLLPVTLGNIVGGVVFVALPLYLIYRNKNKAEA